MYPMGGAVAASFLHGIWFKVTQIALCWSKP
jgi:hypothetical protein